MNKMYSINHNERTYVWGRELKHYNILNIKNNYIKLKLNKGLVILC